MRNCRRISPSRTTPIQQDTQKCSKDRTLAAALRRVPPMMTAAITSEFEAHADDGLHTFSKNSGFYYPSEEPRRMRSNGERENFSSLPQARNDARRPPYPCLRQQHEDTEIQRWSCERTKYPSARHDGMERIT